MLTNSIRPTIAFFSSFILGDIQNVIANVLRAPQAYENLLTGGLATVPDAEKLIIDGFNEGLKKSGVLGAVRGQTGGLVSGLQLIFSNAIKNVLKGKWSNYRFMYAQLLNDSFQLITHSLM